MIFTSAIVFGPALGMVGTEGRNRSEDAYQILLVNSSVPLRSPRGYVKLFTKMIAGDTYKL